MRDSRLQRGVWSFAFLMFSVFLLTSCSSSDSGDPAVDTTVARVEIAPGSVLLPGINQTKTLQAKAYNAAGDEINVDISWSSSNTNNITIASQSNQQAIITSQVSAGSAQLTAQAGGVSSPPIFTVVAMPVANAVLITDDQIARNPELVDPSAQWSIGLEYTVILEGSTPEIGDILIGSEQIPLSGRVVGVNTTGNNSTVTLELVTISELFTELIIDETFPLSLEPEHITPEVAAYYTAEKLSDGSLRFTPKTQQQTQARLANYVSSTPYAAGTAIGTTADLENIYIGPFKCKKGDLDPTSDMITLPSLLPTVDIDKDNLEFILKYKQDGYDFKMAVQGAAKAKFKINPTLNIQIESKLSCKRPMVDVPVPNIPALQLIFGAQVPLGIGFEIGGKLSIAGIGFEIATNVKADAALGIECLIAADCEILKTLNHETDADYKVTFPDNIGLDTTLRLEPTASAFVFTGVNVGNPLFKQFNWGILEFKAGLANNANLATVNGQILDSTYQSDYKLTAELSAGLADGANDGIAFLSSVGVINNGVNSVPVKTSLPIFNSPSASDTALTADVASFVTGDTVTFTVNLNQDTLNYFMPVQAATELGFIGYNVDDIIIYRKEDLGGGVINSVEVTRVTATDGQTKFDIEWIADLDGDITDNFYAFVTTKALPLPVLDELELGKVTPQPQGQKKLVYILHSTHRDGNVYIANINGSGIAQITNSSDILLGHEAVTSNGEQIIYKRILSDSDTLIGLANLDGSGSTTIGATDSSDIREDSPKLSPDNNYIAFTENELTFSNDGTLLSRSSSNAFMSIEGSGKALLSSISSGCVRFVSDVWITNSKLLFWQGNFDGFNCALEYDGTYNSYDVASGNIEEIPCNTEYCLIKDIKSHPSGNKLAIKRRWYSGNPSDPCDEEELFLRDLTTGAEQQITNFNINLTCDDIRLDSYSWSTDGTKLLFVKENNVDNSFDHYIYDLTSLSIQTLFSTNRQRGGKDSVAWSADSNKLAVELDSGAIIKVVNLVNDSIVDIQNGLKPLWNGNDQLSFYWNDANGSTIYTINADGTGRTPIITGPTGYSVTPIDWIN